MPRKIEIPVAIPTLHNSLNELRDIPDDLRLIRARAGLGLTRLARTFGVSKQALWRWQRGESVPKEALVILSIKSWGKELRDNGGELGTKDNHHPSPDNSIVVRPVKLNEGG